MVATPRLASQPSDLFTARLAAALVEGLPTAAASRAVSSVYGVLEETVRRRYYEMALVSSSERPVAPDRRFAPSVIPPRAGAVPWPAAPAVFP